MSHYEINVSRDTGNGYHHYFATADRSLRSSKAKTYHVYKELTRAFPAPEYKVTVKYRENVGTECNPTTMFADLIRADERRAG